MALSLTSPCAGNLAYPFSNKLGKCNVEILTRYVEKEEKIWIELIYIAHVLERICQVASIGEEVFKPLPHSSHHQLCKADHQSYTLPDA